MALPYGSRTPVLSVTVTRAFMAGLRAGLTVDGDVARRVPRQTPSTGLVQARNRAPRRVFCPLLLDCLSGMGFGGLGAGPDCDQEPCLFAAAPAQNHDMGGASACFRRMKCHQSAAPGPNRDGGNTGASARLLQSCFLAACVFASCCQGRACR